MLTLTNHAKLPEIARDTSQPLDARINALIAAMTLEEKAGQLLHEAPDIPRLGIPAYNWWNESSHGVARAGLSTVFPHAIGLAASWNRDLLDAVGVVISDEMRAKHHAFTRNGQVIIYGGLTTWTPNINIVRDPRWGRAQETFGEDPQLTAQLAVAFIRALQGDHPRYLKLAACAKHYAAHSGPEALRHSFNAEVSAYDLWDTYLPAFEACVREADVESVMSAYTRTNGEACSASPTLLQAILRDQWGFAGHVVSDCGAIEDIYAHHQIAASMAHAAALAINNGCDLCCGCAYEALLEAVALGLVSETQIDLSLRRVLRTRFLLGMFDPEEDVPYTQIPLEVVGAPEHRALARRAARESLVLLKNDGILPLSKSTPRLAVIGPNADDIQVQLGNYHGDPVQPVTVLEGIRQAVSADTAVSYARGCDVAAVSEAGFAGAVALAQDADVVIFVGGLSQVLEGEDLQDEGVPPGTTSQGDRQYIELPPVQENLLKALHATGKPVVLVLLNGSALAIPWADAHLAAIVEAWYPGEAGEAVADVLFGDHNPGGRLPLTFYRATADLPPFESYDMQGRTYRYLDAQTPPLYPFGYGLSYTHFAYGPLRASQTTLQPGDALTITVDVRNAGQFAGDEVIQLYLRCRDASAAKQPHLALRHFERLHIPAGQTQTVRFTLSYDDFSTVTGSGERVVRPGRYQVCIGGNPPSGAADDRVLEMLLLK